MVSNSIIIVYFKCNEMLENEWRVLYSAGF